MSASNALELSILDHVLGGPDYTRLGTVYVALFTAAPSDAGGGTEVSTSGTAYARAAVTNNSTNWPGASSGSKSNGVAVSFAVATASWGTVTHWGILSASSGGTLLFHGALSASKTVATGDRVEFAIGAIVISAD